MNSSPGKKRKEKEICFDAHGASYYDGLKAYIKRDFFYIVLLLFALFACIYTIGLNKDVQDNCLDTCRMEWCGTPAKGYDQGWELPTEGILNGKGSEDSINS